MEALEKAWEETKGDIAALIAQPYDHGNFYDNVCSTNEKWQAVRKFCDEHGIVLISTTCARASGLILRAATTITE